MKAEFIGNQEDEHGNPVLSLFNIHAPGHPKDGSTVDLKEAMELGAITTERFKTYDALHHDRASESAMMSLLRGFYHG